MKFYVILLIILLFGFTLRFYKISSVPPGLSNDEISIAYEAYSIINTGRDSNGVFLPLSFKSHGDYKAPLYEYLAGPFIKIIGNNEVAVRLPSIIFGTLTILGIYFLVKKLGLGEISALLSAFLLAITPWHVYTSRIGLESNLALCIVVFATVFFFKGLENNKYLYLASSLFALSLYAYHTEKVFTPIILIVLTCIYLKRISIKNSVKMWMLFLILILPLVLDAIFLKGATRASNEFILNDFLLANKLAGIESLVTKSYTIFTFWFGRYLQYTSFNFIFSNGLPTSAPYGSPDFGLLNILELPLFAIGAFSILFYKDKPVRNFIFSWLLLGPLVPSLTLGEINLVRNLVTVVPLTILSAYGVVVLWNRIKNKLIFVVGIFLVIVNFAFFYKNYMTYFPIYFSENWSYGFKQIAEYTREHEDKYNKIVIDYHYGTNTDLFGAPSLFVLYFDKIDPNKFLKEVWYKEKSTGFGKYEFRMVDWPKEKIELGTLYVVGVRSNPVGGQMVREIHSINLLNKNEAFKFYESYILLEQ